jgi:hypothetical protein
VLSAVTPRHLIFLLNSELKSDVLSVVEVSDPYHFTSPVYISQMHLDTGSKLFKLEVILLFLTERPPLRPRT